MIGYNKLSYRFLTFHKVRYEYLCIFINCFDSCLRNVLLWINSWICMKDKYRSEWKGYNFFREKKCLFGHWSYSLLKQPRIPQFLNKFFLRILTLLCQDMNVNEWYVYLWFMSKVWQQTALYHPIINFLYTY